MNSVKNLTVRVDSSTIVRTVLILVGFVLLYLLREVVLVVLVAVVIASAIEPATRWFEKHHVPRLPGVIFMYLFLALGFASLIYFVIPPLLVDLQEVLSQAPEYIRSIRLGDIGLLDQGMVGQGTDGALSLPDLVRELRFALGGESFSALGFVSGIFGGLISFVLVVTISFYLAVQKNGIKNFLQIVTPPAQEAYVIDLWQRAQYKIGRWLQGQLILMLIVGLLVYLGLMILGVPNALLLGVVAAMMEIIPLFGPILGAIPAILIAILHGGLTLALLTAGLFFIVQQFENNLIHPLVVTKVVGVPPIIVIISLVIGAQLAGFLGIILAVPVAAVILEWINDYDTRTYPPERVGPTTPVEPV